MAKRVQRRRGTTAEHSSFTGALGEITVDTDKDIIVVHDGSTAGGFPAAKQDMSNVSNTVGVTQLNVSDGTNGQVLSTNGSGTLSFSTVDATTAVVGGDLSGTVGNAQIVANAVGTTELATDSVTTLKITDANVTAAKLALDSVTTTKILDVNVTTAKIADSAITSAKILDGAIVAGDLATDSVTSIKILDGNITTAKLATDAITTIKILDGNITTAKLATDSVTTIKITDANVTDAKLSASGTMPAWDGSALTDMPYDVAFTAGFDKDMLKENVAVATYGELIMARAGTFVGESGYADTASSGNTILDILKNGTTIYSTKPQFGSSTALTAGVLSITSFAVADRITFKITAIGATSGQGVRFTLKCKV